MQFPPSEPLPVIPDRSRLRRRGRVSSAGSAAQRLGTPPQGQERLRRTIAFPQTIAVAVPPSLLCSRSSPFA
jgi:hypothetical protein